MTSLKLGCEYFINFWTQTSRHILLGCQEANAKKPTPKSPSGRRLPDTAFLAAKKPTPRPCKTVGPICPTRPLG